MASGGKPFLLQLLQGGVGGQDWGPVIRPARAVGGVPGQVHTGAVLHSLLVDLDIFFACFVTYDRTDWQVEVWLAREGVHARV